MSANNNKRTAQNSSSEESSESSSSITSIDARKSAASSSSSSSSSVTDRRINSNPSSKTASSSVDDIDDDDEVDHLQYKIVIVGDGGVGKTSIAMRFCEDHFFHQYKQTIGVDFFIKRVVLNGSSGEVQVAMQTWDIGGQTIGSKMIANYIFGSQAVLFCYDATNYQSFQDLEDWIDIVKKTFDKEALPYMAIVGNKSNKTNDDEDDRHQDTQKKETNLK